MHTHAQSGGCIEPDISENGRGTAITYLKEPAIDKQTPTIELQLALKEDALVLANLLEFYAYDFSEIMPLVIGNDGRFGYKELPLYWSDPNRHPFFIKADGQLAGMALIKRGSEVSDDQSVWDMTEFFVLRGYRRSGLGMHAAHEVWRRFPGRWEVRVRQANAKAFSFWQQAMNAFTHKSIQSVCFDQDGTWWELFSFTADHP